jgi:hypothetical protein
MGEERGATFVVTNYWAGYRFAKAKVGSVQSVIGRAFYYGCESFSH